MKSSKSITVMVPAYNEERNLARAVNKVDRVVKSLFNDYEILIFNDCSTDNTGEIASKLAKHNKRIRIIHNKRNMGVGYSYRKGMKLSKKRYYMLVSGEGEIYASSLRKILSRVGEADMLISYIYNPEVRSLYRRILSKSFTKLLNLLFGLNIKYYNGCVVHKTALLKNVKMATNGFAYQAEILVRLLKKGHSYIEIPYMVEETEGSELFRITNLIGVFLTVAKLFIDINIRRKK